MAWNRYSLWVSKSGEPVRLWESRDGDRAWLLSHAEMRARSLRKTYTSVEVREALDADVADWQRTPEANRPRVK